MQGHDNHSPQRGIRVPEGTGTADDVNNGNVPGYSGVPTGEEAPEGKKGFIPAPGLALALLALGAAFVLVRRKS